MHLRRADRPLCERMDAEVLGSRAVQASPHADFVHYRLDVTREPELGARLAGPGAALSTLLVDPTPPAGEVVDRRDGWLDVEPFLAFLAAARATSYPPAPSR